MHAPVREFRLFAYHVKRRDCESVNFQSVQLREKKLNRRRLRSQCVRGGFRIPVVRKHPIRAAIAWVRRRYRDNMDFTHLGAAGAPTAERKRGDSVVSRLFKFRFLPGDGPRFDAEGNLPDRYGENRGNGAFRVRTTTRPVALPLEISKIPSSASSRKAGVAWDRDAFRPTRRAARERRRFRPKFGELHYRRESMPCAGRKFNSPRAARRPRLFP